MSEEEIVQNEEEVEAAPEEVKEEAPKEETHEEAPPEKEEPKEEPKRNDTVPLAKYLDVERQLKEFKRQARADAFEREKISLEREYVERGYSEPEAQRLAKREIEDKIEHEETRQRLMEFDVRDLARSGEFYSDAETFKEQIIDVMREKKLSAKEAYLLIRGETRVSELQTKKEQRDLLRKREEPKKPQNSSPAPMDSDYKDLTNDDRVVLKMLQTSFPDDGWTASKFREYKKRRGE